MLTWKYDVRKSLIFNIFIVIDLDRKKVLVLLAYQKGQMTVMMLPKE